MDLFSFRNKSYLTVVDYYSNYIEVCLLNHHTESLDVISHVKAIFARFGIPRVVISDNGPQFASSDFKTFAKTWDFEHKTSSPEYPKANGMAESAVKAVKQIFKKAYKMNEDPYLALLALRSAPSTNDILSPAQKLFKRALRTPLPDFRSLVMHKEPPVQLPAKFDQNLHRKQKEYHDQSAKKLPDISDGATVRIHNKNSWPTKAKVLKKGETPRSYHVQTENGMTLRRNRRDLLQTNEKFNPQPADIEMPSQPSHDANGNSEAITIHIEHSEYRSKLWSNTNPPQRYGFT